VPGIGEVAPGDDLAELIAGAAPWLRDGDVVVVTSKVVSKAEGRLVDLPPGGPERERARVQAIAAETARTVATRGETRIVATQHGFVLASAGVDASNVEASRLVLLPKDPDASARALRAGLARRCGRRVAVVVSDTMGRPWRNGLTDLALGSAGIAPLRDHRGQTDSYGNQLRLTQLAVVDELAAAAELVKGKHDQIPVAVIRGMPDAGIGQDGPGVVATLVRDASQDLFRLGTAEAVAAGLRQAATLPGPEPAAAGGTGAAGAAPDGAAQLDPDRATEPDLDPVAAAINLVAGSGAGSRLEPVRGGPAAVRCTAADPADPAALVRLGADAHRLRAALAAAGIASTARFEPPGAVLLRLQPPDPAPGTP
jgi:coenzyme F420-0:L-glutamate ligase/coenzyme F420-1:gamma-L-glutamate ligase